MTPRRPHPIGHLVLDRDGVLNRETASPVTDAAGWEWERGALDGLRRAADAGLVVSIVTNQSAVARGVLDQDALETLHTWLRREIEGLGVTVVGIWACPHTADDRCTCRKPLPGMVDAAVAAALDGYGIGADRAVLVGDHLRDLAAARGAGVTSVLVRTGKGTDVEPLVPPGTDVCDDLADAVGRIIAMHLTTTDHRDGAAGPGNTR